MAGLLPAFREGAEQRERHVQIPHGLTWIEKAARD